MQQVQCTLALTILPCSSKLDIALASHAPATRSCLPRCLYACWSRIIFLCSQLGCQRNAWALQRMALYRSTSCARILLSALMPPVMSSTDLGVMPPGSAGKEQPQSCSSTGSPVSGKRVQQHTSMCASHFAQCRSTALAASLGDQGTQHCLE